MQQILRILFGCWMVGAMRPLYIGECDLETPEFSHLTGQPLITPVTGHGQQAWVYILT